MFIENSVFVILLLMMMIIVAGVMASDVSDGMEAASVGGGAKFTVGNALLTLSASTLFAWLLW